MDLRLFSIEQMPSTIPVWDTILQDLGAPRPERVARALGVGRATVYRWNAEGCAPRAACLALFWLTRWGRSAVDAQATNDAVLALQYARALAEERLQLRDQVQRLEGINGQLLLAGSLAGQLPLVTRGNAATAERCHMDTAAEALPVAPRTPALAWPALVLPMPDWPPLELDPAPDAVHQGSPGAPRQADHSSTSQGFERTPQPLFSDPQAVARWSPSLDSVISEWRHSDTMPERRGTLLELRQAPQSNPIQTLTAAFQRAGSSGGPPAVALAVQNRAAHASAALQRTKPLAR